uniref:Mediator of RNA polymerase II transcription subunit 31 n=1 Tax=Physcomitrium patens TaxID=3218 RepID=A0A2K1JN58_PHYPA|nr:hypothetical protein PHYPA_017809 [Physcomitrium patens]
MPVNPTFIHYLEQNRYFNDEAFVSHVKFLLIWKQTDYAKDIIYPHVFFLLDMLQGANFREAMAHPANKLYFYRRRLHIASNVFYLEHYRNDQLKQRLSHPLMEELAPPPAPPTAPTPAVAAAPIKSEGSRRLGEWYFLILSNYQ